LRIVEEIRDGKVVKTGGIEWTIKDGIPFHAPTLAAEIRDIVVKARRREKSPIRSPLRIGLFQNGRG
jgi:hypothetical protein